MATCAPSMGAPSRAPAIPDTDSKQNTKFNDALADYLLARENLHAQPDDVSVEADSVAGAAFLYAVDRLIGTPAETISDFRAKFDSIWLENNASPNGETVQALFADLRRLTGDEPSRIFDPQHWLGWFTRNGGMYCVRTGEVFLLSPNGSHTADQMFELEASGGRAAVDALILSQTAGEV